jgi:hypothetical protein
VIPAPGFTGKASYYSDYEEGPDRLFVAVTCLVADYPDPLRALLDTGSEWCLLPSRVSRAVGYDLTPDDVVPPLLTRFGRIFGQLERIPIQFVAEEGIALQIDATCFLSPDWPGPMVIGWKGGLERIRIALDPGEEAFYFASL